MDWPVKTPPENTRQDVGLVESPFPLSASVERNRHDRINGGVAEEVPRPLGHEAAEMPPQGDSPTVFEEEEDVPQEIVSLIEDG